MSRPRDECWQSAIRFKAIRVAGFANRCCRSGPWSTVAGARLDSAARRLFTKNPGEPPMKFSSAFRAALVALIAFAGVSAAHADEGFVSLTIYKAGWIIGGSGGG